MDATHLACKSLAFFCHSFFFLLFLQNVRGGTLKAAVIIFRHGDRTPFESFPTDIYKENSWPQGFGQLSKRGIQEQYELGEYLQKRYANLLSLEYKREEITVVSTDYDRTIMSALATLAGLYPPMGNQIWNREILWQPIPVHTVPHSQDNIHSPIPGCPRYIRIQDQTMKSKKFQRALKPYTTFFNTLATYTGYDVATLKNLTNWKTFNVYDVLQCEIAHNYTLPSWATKNVLANLKKLSELTFLSLYGIYKKKEKSQLQGGVHVKAVLQDITNATALDNKRKLMVYSAHATTIAAFQMALNIYNGKVPPFASCQFVELHEHESRQYTIEMYFRNDTSRDPYPITLPGCAFSCPLTKFTELVTPIIVENWAKECGKEAQ